MNLIYFDTKQLEDYFFDDEYKKAYNSIVEEENILFWTGRIKTDSLICLNEQGESFPVNIHHINRVLVRGKNFPYHVFKHYNVEIINKQRFEDIFSNKLHTKIFLKALDDLPNITCNVYAIDELKEGNKYVLKPTEGLKGEGILISDDISQIKNQVKIFKAAGTNYIIEDFVKPIPFKGHSIYDIRVVVVGLKPVLTLLRVPAEGSELANLAQGGSKEILDYYKLDKKVQSILERLIDFIYIKFRNSVYSIDFSITEEGINIFEFNTYPGIRLEYTKYLETLKEMLVGKRRKKISLEF